MQTFDKSHSVQRECNPSVNLTLIVQQGQTTVVGVHSHVNNFDVFVRGMRLDWFLLLVFVVQISKRYNFHMSCRVLFWELKRSAQRLRDSPLD